MIRDGARGRLAPTRSSGPGWLVIARQEWHDLWVGGRGPMLLLVFSVLLSCVTYLAATNQVLNFLEQREAVNLALQVAMAVGVLVTLVVSADAISGERERGTLETLLLSPVSRPSIVTGKLAGALSLWLAAWVVSVPYLWVLGRGVSLVGSSLLIGLSVGTLLAVAMAAVGTLISALCSSNRVSISVSIFLLVALSAPTQLPTGLAQTRLGDALLRANPIGSSLHYASSVIVRAHGWLPELSYLASPLITALLAGLVLRVAGPRIVGLSGGVEAG